ncbi:MAG TPA: DUF4129 domain-containing protein [Thermoplasmata archaeon]|nr:DUF4129 domain-containing protein [Thermoplasmata archaeon]
MTNPPAARVSWVLLVVLVAALATGAAASILVSASTAPPASPGPAPLVILPLWVVSAASTGILLFVLASMVLWRVSSGSNPMMSKITVSVLVAVLIGIVFVLAARFLGVGGPVGTNSTATSGSSNSSAGANATGTGSPGSGGYLSLFPSLPGWVPIVVLGLVALVVVVVLVPQARAYLADRRERRPSRRAPTATVPVGVHEALSRASAELDLGGDPRLVILALYSELLERLRPMVSDIETSTPEEIRAAHLIRFRVRPEAAGTLTRLFEEARYSTHPMGPEAGTRVREAVRMTLDDLDRQDFPA